jgi:hypothetical protein
MSKAWDRVKDYSFEKRDDFTANAKAASAKMDVHLSEVRANFSEAKASSSVAKPRWRSSRMPKRTIRIS